MPDTNDRLTDLEEQSNDDAQRFGRIESDIADIKETNVGIRTELGWHKWLLMAIFAFVFGNAVTGDTAPAIAASAVGFVVAAVGDLIHVLRHLH